MTAEALRASAVDAPTRLPLWRLAVDMLRFRVALMMWLFMLLAAAYHGIPDWPLDRLAALTIALAASYIVATTVNDIADEQIDKINHPLGRGRPLVHGEATHADLWRLNVIAAVVSLAFGAYVGWRGVAVVVASLIVAYAYSVPPLVISHRTYAAAPVLTLAYVVAPYLHGLALAETSPGPRDLALACGLGLLFLSRIVLKDFRDRPGDATYGKPTLLLRFGVAVTCAVSAAALLLGAAVLIATLHDVVAACVVCWFVAGIGRQLFALKNANDVHVEQVAIGIGARAGNGLLITLLAWLLLRGQAAPPTTILLSTLGVAAAFTVSYATLALQPERVILGYKG